MPRKRITTPRDQRRSHKPATRRSARIRALHLHDAKPGATQISPLLRLPAELRNRIYELVLCEQTVVIKRSPDPKFGVQEPGILKTCAQLRKEATTLYYEQAIFMGNIWDLRDWATALGPQRSGMLRKLRADYWDEHGRRPVLSFCSTLQTLQNRVDDIDKARIRDKERNCAKSHEKYSVVAGYVLLTSSAFSAVFARHDLPGQIPSAC